MERNLDPSIPADALDLLAHVVSLVAQPAGPAPQQGLPGYRITDKAIETLRGLLPKQEAIQ
jgi:hypothetical protein